MMSRIQPGTLPPAASSRHRKLTKKRRTAQSGQQALRPALLPALRVALDGTAMNAYLCARLLPIVRPDRQLAVTQIELLDYKPGQRGLIRYELSAPAGCESYTLFGKVYADPGQLACVHQVMQTLWEDVFTGNRHCGVPQPLGMIQELSMVVYLSAEGQFLDQAIASQRGAAAVELTAEWLSMLHRYPLQLTKKFQLESELTNLAEWAALVGRTYPEVGELAHRSLAYLQQQATSLPLATETPIHKDFHYRHVLVERGIKVIDFDELRLGDPNFDLAHFCANLHLLAYRQHGSPQHLRHLEQRFLDAYARHTGWNLTQHGSRFIYFYVYTCLKLARQLCLGFGPSPIPSGEEQKRQVQLSLSQGVAAIAMLER